MIATRGVYVSLDIDAVDPAFAPGTGTPEVGGFTSHQMLQLVCGLSGLDFAGFDTQMMNPPLKGSRKADIVILGGGFTGLASAYHLIQ